ncbi:hypothetical protein N0B51_02325 [Tsuneonella sp. YG55]|uniref:Sulfotransferase family protein n=1 Tax=Tsuneonella litorea TaxID=2976475 RepID=A0A9X2VZ42_9SPHN|nr:hypothetical protein [Tsuneonella litorea]MCT2557811.1 hypothetical protein [Tsuneonella litorea]
MSALMILGMHRSFTSLTAHWLMKCGLDIGADLLPGSQGNDDGHFEDLQFLALHEEILRENGLPEDGLRFVHDRAFLFDRFAAITVSPRARRQAIALAATRPPQFGWKDPRTCLFLPLWREVLRQATSLVVVRHFDEVVRSLDRRDRALVKQNANLRDRFRSWRDGRYRSHDAFLGAWVHYNRCLLDHIRLGETFVVTDLVGQADAAIRWLRGRGFALDPVPITTVARPTPPPDPDRLSYRYDGKLLAEARALFGDLAAVAGATSAQE